MPVTAARAVSACASQPLRRVRSANAQCAAGINEELGVTGSAIAGAIAVGECAAAVAAVAAAVAAAAEDGVDEFLSETCVSNMT